MTPAQLLTLADEHQAAQQSGGTRADQSVESGPGLLAMAAMQ